MSRLARLVADQRRPLHVDVLGLRWHLRVPSPVDLFAAGATQLPRVVPAAPGGPLEASAPVDPAEVDPSLVEGAARMSRALVCASVVGVSEVPTDLGAPLEVEALTLVPELADERPDEGRLWVGSLSPSAQATILAALTDHLSGGALGRAIATFRARPE